MANELRVRQNFIGGKVEDNPLLIGAVTLTSAALAAVVAIGATQHFPIILDPDGLYGEPEIAYITAHSAGATTATILRAQEGSTARQHKQDVDWSHGPTAIDFASLVQGGEVQASETTVSNAFTDLATVGPSAVISVPASGRVRVGVGCNSYNDTVPKSTVMGFALTGANTVAAADARASAVTSTAALAAISAFYSVVLSGLTAGLTTFTAKYYVSGGTGTFRYRTIIVEPLP